MTNFGVLAIALLSVTISVAAQFALKAGLQHPMALETGATASFAAIAAALTRPWVIAGLSLYALSALVWFIVLSRWEVSKAYPLVGAGFVLSVAVGWCMGETVSATRWLGVAFITLGVALVARS